MWKDMWETIAEFGQIFGLIVACAIIMLLFRGCHYLDKATEAWK